MARRKQCKEKGCRKGRAEGSDFCEEHMTLAGGNGVGVNEAPDPVFAEDEVMKLTEAELDKFNLLRLKMEHKLQAIRVLELEQERADREYVAQKHTREQLVRHQRGEIEPLNNEYLGYVRQLAHKYKLHPEHLGIDDETGVLRDLRPQQQEP